MGAENHRYIAVSSTLEPSHTFPRYLLHPMNPSPKWKFGLKTCLTTPLCMMTRGFVLEKVTPTGGVSMCSRAAFFRPRLVCFGPFGARARRFSKPKVHFGKEFFRLKKSSISILVLQFPTHRSGKFEGNPLNKSYFWLKICVRDVI